MNKIRQNTACSTSTVYFKYLINVDSFFFNIRVTLLDIGKESYLSQMEPTENYNWDSVPQACTPGK